jgi:hypothetical protein
MKTFAVAFAAVALSSVVAFGCKSSDFADIDLGTSTVGPYSVHVLQEADFGPNLTTKYALQPTPTVPDKIECWYGAETTTPHVTASFDANDKDFDCLVPTPATTLPTDKLWFTLFTGTTSVNGSVTPHR